MRELNPWNPRKGKGRNSTKLSVNPSLPTPWYSNTYITLMDRHRPLTPALRRLKKQEAVLEWGGIKKKIR